MRPSEDCKELHRLLDKLHEIMREIFEICDAGQATANPRCGYLYAQALSRIAIVRRIIDRTSFHTEMPF